MVTIRREILNMPLRMWQKLPAGEVVETTAEAFLADIGLPGGDTAKFNEQEAAFFENIYALSRRITLS